MNDQLLQIRHLRVSFSTERGELQPVNDISLTVPEGKIVGIVGESGCGKSMTVRAVMGLVPSPGRITGGQILLNGRDLTGLSEKQRSALRGSEISMIFQEPMTSLNPVVKVGRQIEEAVRLHERISGKEARKRVTEMLEAVGIPDAEKRSRCYPHQLSGGMRQRVMIAMAMICKPKLLIADEPTTALDVTVEAQILQLMRELSARGTSILLISHNLGVIAQACDWVYVMYAGRVVESADTFSLFERPLHPYTRGLLDAVTSLGKKQEVLDIIPGLVPSLSNLPAGCSFAPRCGLCAGRCEREMPELIPVTPGHDARCFRIGEEAKA